MSHNTYMMHPSSGKEDFDWQLRTRTPSYSEGVWTIPGHEHPLIMKDPRAVYRSLGFWICDLCKVDCAGPTAHCALCGFDVCSGCLAGELQPS